MANTALINGVNYSWGNLTLVLYGSIVIGLTKLSYRKKSHKENNYGQGNEPVSRGYGRNEYEASVTLYTDELKRLIAAAPNNDITQIPPDDVIVMFAGTRVLPNKDILQAFEFLEDGLDASEGDTKLLVDLPCIIAGVKRSA